MFSEEGKKRRRRRRRRRRKKERKKNLPRISLQFLALLSPRKVQWLLLGEGHAVSG